MSSLNNIFKFTDRKKKYDVDVFQYKNDPIGKPPEFDKQDLLQANVGHIAAAIDTICKSVADNTFLVYDVKSGESLPNHPFSKLLDFPNDFDGEYSFTYKYTSQMLWSGDAFIFKQPDNTMNVLASDQMQIVPSETEYIKGYIYTVVSPEDYTRDEIILIQNPNPDMKTQYGQSIIAKMAAQSNIQKYMNASEEELNKNDSAPAMYMTTSQSLTDPQIDSLKTKFWQMFKRGGSQRKKTFIGHSNLELKPFRWTPVEVEFLKSKAYNRDDIYELAGIPQSIRGKIDTGYNKSTADSVYQTYLREVVRPYITMIAQQWSLEFRKQYKRDFDRGLRVWYDESKLKVKDAELDHIKNIDAYDRDLISSETFQERENFPTDHTPTEIIEPVETKFFSIKKKLNSSQLLYRRQSDNKKKRIENKFDKRLTQQFKKITLSVLDQIEELRKAHDETHYNFSGYANETFIISSQFITESFKSGYEQVLRFYDIDSTFDVGSAKLRQVLKDRESLIKNAVNVTLKEDIKAAIIKSNELGETFEQLTKRLKDIGTYNAERIAVTEVTQAFNEGVYDSALEENFKYKRWLTMNDSKVRQAHLDAQNEGAILQDKEFAATGLKYPAQPNCRCTLMPVKEK